MRILFIDDNFVVLKVYSQMLIAQGYIHDDDKINYMNSPNLLDINDFEKLNSFDVIICDFDLGDNNPNGLQFFTDIDDKFKGIKILLSADNSKELKIVSKSLKNINFINKASPTKNMKLVIHELGNLIIKGKI